MRVLEVQWSHALNLMCGVALRLTPCKFSFLLVCGVTNIKGMQVLFWLLFLVEHLYLIGVWLGEDPKTNIIKTHV